MKTEHEIRCECGFLIGFSTNEIIQAGTIECHYCAIERIALFSFLGNNELDDNRRNDDGDFGSKEWWKRFTSNPAIRTSAFYSAQQRERLMDEFFSGLYSLNLEFENEPN